MLNGVFLFFGSEIYLEWYMLSMNENTKTLTLEMQSIGVIILLFIRAIFFIICVFEHMWLDVNFKKIYVCIFHIFMQFFTAILFVAFTAFKLSSAWRIVTITLNTIWYYYVFVSISAIIAGKYREAVRQVPPHLVQMPREIVVNQGEHQGEHQGEQDPPFNRRCRLSTVITV
jgi:hypothetical protein